VAPQTLSVQETVSACARRCSSARPPSRRWSPSRSACRASRGSGRSPLPSRCSPPGYWRASNTSAGADASDLAKQVRVWASPANAGAERLANELASAFAGLSVSTSDTPEQATHMLLYLNEETWSDERLGEQVKQARADKLPIVMAHENDPTRGGCLFAKFFETTPQELIAGGLYSSQVARSCFPGRHHEARANPIVASRGWSRYIIHALCRCRSCLLQRASARLPQRRRWTSVVRAASSDARFGRLWASSAPRASVPSARWSQRPSRPRPSLPRPSRRHSTTCRAAQYRVQSGAGLLAAQLSATLWG
jgi:hypothetical protein